MPKALSRSKIVPFAGAARSASCSALPAVTVVLMSSVIPDEVAAIR
jgi:hypothetical protein